MAEDTHLDPADEIERRDRIIADQAAIITQLRKVIAAVADLHYQYRGVYDEDLCGGCSGLTGSPVFWPCKTAIAAGFEDGA